MKEKIPNIIYFISFSLIITGLLMFIYETSENEDSKAETIKGSVPKSVTVESSLTEADADVTVTNDDDVGKIFYLKTINGIKYDIIMFPKDGSVKYRISPCEPGKCLIEKGADRIMILPVISLALSITAFLLAVYSYFAKKNRPCEKDKEKEENIIRKVYLQNTQIENDIEYIAEEIKYLNRLGEISEIYRMNKEMAEELKVIADEMRWKK